MLNDNVRATTELKDLNSAKQNLLLELQNYQREVEPITGDQFSSLQKVRKKWLM